MQIKSNHKLIVISVVFLFTAFSGLIFWQSKGESVFSDNKSEFIDTSLNEFRKIIEAATIESENNFDIKIEKKYSQLGIISHHLPVAVSLISDFYTFLKNNQGPRDIFIILGPDHFERGYSSVSTTYLPFVTPFGELEVEKNIVNELVDKGIGLDDKALTDHSIGVQAGFIKLFFPQARIVPLVFRANTNQQIIAKVADIIAKHQNEVSVIASVDFSHYQSYQQAQVLDSESGEMISNFNFNDFTLECVDSPPTMRLVGKLVELFEMNEVAILDIVNSYNFTGKTDNTTGYISAFFNKIFLQED
jgi:AmmeMemoRadiSam system protein B